MADQKRNDSEFDDEPRRATGRESMRRKSIANTRKGASKRGGPAKFNGIHRRRSKRVSW